jgi:hypothetical protein
MNPTALAALLFVLPAACGSTAVPEQPRAEPVTVYPIDANTADAILKDAMSREFAAEQIERVTAPHMGFKATTYAALDHSTLSVYRVQANGRRSDGSTVAGFSFELKTTGVGDEGTVRAARVKNRILAAAKREAHGLPLAAP